MVMFTFVVIFFISMMVSNGHQETPLVFFLFMNPAMNKLARTSTQ